jgi:hypothetical protein
VVLAAGLVFGSGADAQAISDEGQLERPDAPRAVYLTPIYEGGVRNNRSIHIPVNLRAGPERRISVGYTASNSFLDPGFLVCADRSCRLEYETDHTGNLLFASVTQPVLAALELGFSVGTYQMGKIPNLLLVHRLASDSVLRSFHENILHQDSLPELAGAPDGRQVFTMTDLGGRRLTLDAGHFYALPLRLDLTRYFTIRRTQKTQMSLNAGAHLSYPLEGDLDASSGHTALSRGMDFGISVNFTHSRRLTPNVASTYHVQIARFKSDVHVVNPNSPLQGDDNLRSQYALTYGLRFGGTFAGKAPCSFALSQLSVTSQFDLGRYWTQDPVVFVGGDNLRSAIMGTNDYGVATFACDYRGRQLQVSVVEDIGGFSQLITDDGAGNSYDPDLAVSVSASWTLGARRAAAGAGQ